MAAGPDYRSLQTLTAGDFRPHQGPFLPNEPAFVVPAPCDATREAPDDRLPPGPDGRPGHGGQRRRAAAQLPPVAVLEQGTAVSRLLDLLEEVTGATLTDEQRARVLGPGQDG